MQIELNDLCGGYVAEITFLINDTPINSCHVMKHRDVVSFLALIRLVFGHVFHTRHDVVHLQDHGTTKAFPTHTLWTEVLTTAYSGEISLLETRPGFEKFVTMFADFGVTAPPIRFRGEPNIGFRLNGTEGELFETPLDTDTIAVFNFFHNPYQQRFGCEVEVGAVYLKLDSMHQHFLYLMLRQEQALHAATT